MKRTLFPLPAVAVLVLLLSGLTAASSAPGSPAVGGRLYALGYSGEGPDLQEMLICMDAGTGKKLWEHRFNDFLSDTVYNRYAIGSPAIDPETGNVYATTSAGIFLCCTADGK